MWQARGNALPVVKSGVFLGNCVFCATQEGLAVLRCGTRASASGGLEPKADALPPVERWEASQEKAGFITAGWCEARVALPRPTNKDGMVIDL